MLFINPGLIKITAITSTTTIIILTAFTFHGLYAQCALQQFAGVLDQTANKQLTKNEEIFVY